MKNTVLIRTLIAGAAMCAALPVIAGGQSSPTPESTGRGGVPDFSRALFCAAVSVPALGEAGE